MQDNPPPGDGPAPQAQQPDDQRPPDADAAPHSDPDFDLNAVGVDTAQQIYKGDAAGGAGSGAAGHASPLEKQLNDARAQYRSLPGREPYLRPDPLTPYERGIRLLLKAVPDYHHALGDVTSLCRRLQENIDYTRLDGSTPTLESQRSGILRQLDNQTLDIFEITFTQLYLSSDSSDVRDSGGGAGRADERPLPTTQREVADWYAGLHLLARCYVVAVCVLQGAPSHEVSNAAHELHLLIERARPVGQTASNTAPNDEERRHNGAQEQDFIFAEDLLADTHTVARKDEGAERILWRDEALDPLVHEFLARQATTVGMRFGERNLLDILQEWAVSDDAERAFRAARALAELWWRQHQQTLLELAERWASSAEPQIWQGGASLLYGAYVAERADRPNLKDADSIALRRLRRWADWRDGGGLAMAAAYAYGLIGRQWPGAALDGLDDLLCLGANVRKDNTIPPLPILFLAMLSYVEMASSGQIRPLLTRFASHVEHYTLRAQASSHGLLEPASSHGPRQRSLEMVFFHFVFLAALSTSGVGGGGNTHLPYLIDVGLLPRPDMPSARGQDVLLAGLLSNQEPEWRASVQTLLCAAISTEREQMAFDLLASWIRIVTFEPRTAALDALKRFVLDLHHQLSDWDGQLKKTGFRSGNGALEQCLRSWARASREHVLRPFAQSVIDALHR